MNSSNSPSTKPRNSSAGVTKTAPNVDELALVQISQRFLQEMRQGGSGDGPLRALQAVPRGELLHGLASDAAKMAFWINVYNAANLHRLLRFPMTDLRSKRLHFWGRHLTVAGLPMSLNAIEHGILRRSRLWWARGYLRDPFPTRVERHLRVRRADPRIHFALNCGARSCPPIMFYDVATIDAQLEMATRAFMLTEVHWDGESRQIAASSLLSMYAGDFGGLPGIRHWISRYRPETIGAAGLRFSQYDWTPQLHNFRD